VIAFFRETLGYAYLGQWHDREGNSNVEGGFSPAGSDDGGAAKRSPMRLLWRIRCGAAAVGSDERRIQRQRCRAAIYSGTPRLMGGC
jgi:hypothetical protein